MCGRMGLAVYFRWEIGGSRWVWMEFISGPRPSEDEGVGEDDGRGGEGGDTGCMFAIFVADRGSLDC